ncbi:MAG: hypothetical protein UX94_C0007G0008 [Parcubacteria group bacterium GW2011_GWA2_47_21]|nr:MAG: hypothetical protein UX94_C0007G0008 [Parcubacteria group bacterium GW2011_GWA2_47_21]
MRTRTFIYPAFLAGVASVLPFVAFAQSTIDSLLTRVRTTATFIIGLLFIVATLVFLWGIVQFIASAGDEAKRKTSKGLMTWGIIGLAVMAAAWGITQVLVDYFLVPAEGPFFRRYPTPRL